MSGTKSSSLPNQEVLESRQPGIKLVASLACFVAENPRCTVGDITALLTQQQSASRPHGSIISPTSPSIAQFNSPFSSSDPRTSPRQASYGAGFLSDTLSSSTMGGQATAHVFFNPKLNVADEVHSFVSDLTFRCVTRHPQTGIAEFQSWRGNVALLFVDLSGYSKVANALAARGAYALSDAVNSYFQSLTDIILKYQGDILTFAGDAIIAAWHNDAILGNFGERRSCLMAARCAVELQRQCGMHPVSIASMHPLYFRLHIGLSFGEVEVDVLIAKSSKSMQRCFPYITGDPFFRVGATVEAAKAGEIGMDRQVMEHIEQVLIGKSNEGCPQGVYILLKLDEDLVDEALTSSFHMDEDADGELNNDLVNEDSLPMEAPSTFVRHHIDRQPEVERQFVHPAIVRRMQQGVKLDYMAEMRFLAVLFIVRNCPTAIQDWFQEVQEVLDVMRCPVVQVIHDDKGAHVVAAVNLFQAEVSPVDTAVSCARHLLDCEVGCHIGMAAGYVFCGIMGGSFARRWDITGAACVRACRLMQHAAHVNAAVITDESVFEAVSDATQLCEVGQGIEVKGGNSLVKIYTLSSAAHFAGTLLAEVATHLYSQELWADAQEKVRIAILGPEGSSEKRYPCHRTVTIVHGPIGCGKSSMCINALRGTKMFVPFRHACYSGAPNLSLAKSFAAWFQHHPCPTLKSTAETLSLALERGHISRSLTLLLRLTNDIVQLGYCCAVIVQSAQLLDSVSLSFVRELLAMEVRERVAERGKEKFNDGGRETPGSEKDEGGGRVALLFTMTPLYGALSPHAIMNTLLRGWSDENAKVCPIELVSMAGQVNNADAHSLWTAVNTWSCASDFFKMILKNTASSPAFIAQAAKYMQKCNMKLLSGNALPQESSYFISRDGCVRLLQKGEKEFNSLSWREISPSLFAKCGYVFDCLSPSLQLMMRVIAALTFHVELGKGVPKSILVGVVRRLMKSRTDPEILKDLETLKHYLLIQFEKVPVLAKEEPCCSIVLPALCQSVAALSTPDQTALLNRRGASIMADGAFGSSPNAAQQLLMLQMNVRSGNKELALTTLKSGWLAALHLKKEAEEGHDANKAHFFIEVSSRYHFYLQELKVSDPINFFGKDALGLQTTSDTSVDADNLLPKNLDITYWSQKEQKLEAYGRMSKIMVQIKNFFGPLALGSIGGVLTLVAREALQHFCECMVGSLMATQSPRRLSGSIRLLTCDIQSYERMNPQWLLHALAAVDNVMPLPNLSSASGDGSKQQGNLRLLERTREQEFELILDMCQPLSTEDAAALEMAEQRAEKFMKNCAEWMAARVQRVREFVQTLEAFTLVEDMCMSLGLEEEMSGDEVVEEKGKEEDERTRSISIAEAQQEHRVQNRSEALMILRKAFHRFLPTGSLVAAKKKSTSTINKLVDDGSVRGEGPPQLRVQHRTEVAFKYRNAFEHALMDCAVMNWASPFPKQTLGYIRECILREGTADPLDFAAMLFVNMVVLLKVPLGVSMHLPASEMN